MFLNSKEMHREIHLNELFLSKLQVAHQNSTEKEFLNCDLIKVMQAFKAP